jgi:hypothetical protein
MSNLTLLREAVLINLLAWWGVRVLTTQMSFMHTFVEESPEWFGVRLLRAGVVIAIILAWARWRQVPWHNIKVVGPNFWRNFAVAFGFVVALWIGIVTVRGTDLWAPDPIPYGSRVIALIATLVDVFAQQLATFGLLQGLGAPILGKPPAFALAWLSFALAHFIMGALPLALVGGTLFGLLLWRTENLGTGLGLHYSIYFMLSVLGWGA